MLDFDDPSLCRGTSVCKVLSTRSAIFRSATGSSKTYALSDPVDRIDYFLSHNWSTPAFTKYLIVLMHENLAFALVCAQITACCIAALGMFGVLPVVRLTKEVSSLYCFIASNACFYFMLFFGHRVRQILFLQRPSYIFLDKICIHQTDKNVQSQGLAKLGAFLKVSKGMLIIQSEAYFSRLWTVYEFATYIIYAAQHGKAPRISIFTTAMPWAMLAIHLSTVVGQCGLLFAPSSFMLWPLSEKSLNMSELLWLHGRETLFSGPFVLPVVFGFRKIVRDRAASIQQLKGFSVQHAKCSVESDRQVLHRNIVALMEHAGFASEGATMTQQGRLQTLARFDGLVQDNCQPMMDAYIGKQCFPYLMVAACGLGMLQYGVDMAIDRHSRGASLGYVFFILEHSTFTYLLGMLECGQAWLYFCHKLKHLKGWREIAWLVFICAAGLLWYNGVRAINFALGQLALSSPWMWTLVAGYWMLLAARHWSRFREADAHIDFGIALEETNFGSVLEEKNPGKQGEQDHDSNPDLPGEVSNVSTSTGG